MSLRHHLWFRVRAVARVRLRSRPKNRRQLSEIVIQRYEAVGSQREFNPSMATHTPARNAGQRPTRVQGTIARCQARHYGSHRGHDADRITSGAPHAWIGAGHRVSHGTSRLGGTCRRRRRLHRQHRCLSYAASPDGAFARTVFGSPCAGRWISCCGPGRSFLSNGDSITGLPACTDR